MRRGILGGLALAGLTLSGCYNPSPPSGAYTCQESDQGGCPKGQRCTCGLCVSQDADAACSLALSIAGGKTLTVKEHEKFELTVSAKAKDGSPATGFAGTVKLVSTWGDVSPASVVLKGGAATVSVELNRETIPPAVARVIATVNGAQGKSPDINVTVPRFIVDGAPALAPAAWADGIVSQGSVLKGPNGYEMYFVASGLLKSGLGYATSPDGRTFTIQGESLVERLDLLSPTAVDTPAGRLLVFATSSGLLAGRGPAQGPFEPLSPDPVLTPASCAYCADTVAFPQVISDVLAPASADGSRPLLMFFSAIDANGAVSIGRASSADGVTWAPEPAPILAGNTSGEPVLLSPRVLVDGSVYKMWYAFTQGTDSVPADLTTCSGTGQGTCPDGEQCVNQVCQDLLRDPYRVFCSKGLNMRIGYATSADGYFWTRSLSNPVLTSADVEQMLPRPRLNGLETGPAATLLPTAVVHTNGDPSSGVTLYFSPFRNVRFAQLELPRCRLIGVQRATR